MNEHFFDRSIEEIRRGYRANSQLDGFECLYCGKFFSSAEVFVAGDRYLLAQGAVAQHVHASHGPIFDQLVQMDKKYTSLTENQRDLLCKIRQGFSDKQIAKENGVSASTVRHQRFSFREKARQARAYLAIYELAMEGLHEDQNLLEVPGGAKGVDDRYMITKNEEEKVLLRFFSSLSPLVLETFSTKEKNRVVILTKICEQFEKGRNYSEKEVNAILKPIYSDFPWLRRSLIEHGFMDRKPNGSAYWVIER